MHGIGAIASSYAAAGGGGWTPADLPNLVAWYDAADLATITATGNDVTAWADKSGNGHHLTTQSGTPKTGTVTQNGLNVIVFDGSSSYMAGDDSINEAQPYTIYVVRYWISGTGFGRIVSSGSDAQLIVYDGVAEVGWYAGADFATAGGAPSTGWAVVGAVANGASSVAFVNGSDGSPHNAGSNGLLNGPTLGARGDGSFLLNGRIAEVFISGDADDGPTRAVAQAYGADKWGL